LNKIFSLFLLSKTNDNAKYVTQLLGDLAVAKGNVPPKPNVKLLYPDHPALSFGFLTPSLTSINTHILSILSESSLLYLL
jgi:hypothetical protein